MEEELKVIMEWLCAALFEGIVLLIWRNYCFFWEGGGLKLSRKSARSVMWNFNLFSAFLTLEFMNR